MQAIKSKVSVIVVNFNDMPHIDACLSSVLSQDYPDFEVIFVDNHSSDGSLEYVRQNFPRLTIVANSENLGYAGGINAGLSHATGHYIAPLNIDTEVAPEWMTLMAAFLDQNPHAGAVTPKVLLFNNRSKINTLGLDIHITALGFCRRLNMTDDGRTAPERVSGLSGCSYMIRRELFGQMGGVQVEGFPSNDDVVVSWMLNLMGWDLYCVPAAVVYHKYRVKMNPEKVLALEKNRLALLLYGWKPTTLLVCSPAFAFTELLIGAYCLLRGRRYLSSKVRAVFLLRQEKARIRQRRALVRRLRRVSDLQMLRRLRIMLDWRQVLPFVQD